ncbi:MAG: DUF687 domain-containing protein [Actinomycetota bacterium]|nr:DUF687 domain-containing protein [Actinomycetota bacterium]
MSSSRTSARATRTRVAGFLSAVIKIVGGLIVLILVGHIVLVVGEANPTNEIARFVASWADRLHLGFRNLFTPADARVRVAANYGLAALCWLIATWLLARLVRRFG